MYFKQIFFARLKRLPEDKNKPVTTIFEPVKKELSLFLNWSQRQQGSYKLKECFLNFENKSIFNSGVITRELNNDRWEVEIVLTTPLPYSTITEGTDFAQPRNFVNYSYQKHLFFSQPNQFFESLDYKELSKVQKSEIQYYCSHIHGLEVLLYQRQGFLQLIQTYPIEMEPEARTSLGKKLLLHLKDWLSPQKIIISDNTLKPQDFVDIEQL